VSRKRPQIERKNGRIYFGESDQLWSAPDPNGDCDAGVFAMAYLYLTEVCPDTKTALEKLRLIRWAIRNVPIQRPNRGGDNG
jgi:hypothetical protein